MNTSCWDCYVAAQVAYISGGKCAKHSTAEERAEFERCITELHLREHPALKMASMRRAPDPDAMLDIPAELEALRRKHDATGGDLTLAEHERYERLAMKLRSMS